MGVGIEELGHSLENERETTRVVLHVIIYIYMKCTSNFFHRNWRIGTFFGE